MLVQAHSRLLQPLFGVLLGPENGGCLRQNFSQLPSTSTLLRIKGLRSCRSVPLVSTQTHSDGLLERFIPTQNQEVLYEIRQGFRWKTSQQQLMRFKGISWHLPECGCGAKQASYIGQSHLFNRTFI